MSVIDDAHAAEAVEILDTIFKIEGIRAAHDSGEAVLSATDYMAYGEKRTDAVLNFAKKFKIAYSDAQVATWYQAQKA